jgi:large subunit ribosomal protein L32
MGALPKSRISPRRRRARRTHYKLHRVKLVRCPTCEGWQKPHHVCLSCGSYRGVQVVELEDDLG